MGKWFACIDELAKAGKYDNGEALLPGGKVIKGNLSSLKNYYLLPASLGELYWQIHQYGKAKHILQRP